MKPTFLIAPDSFKDSLDAKTVAKVIAAGIHEVLGDAVETICLPIADGGEGTLAAMVEEKDCRFVTVHDPIGRKIQAAYGKKGRCAVIEMARAAGLTLLSEEERHAARCSTWGVGELILAALDDGCEEILLTVGGSATNDAGCGMMAALGARFMRADGSVFIPTGENVGEIASFSFDGVDARLRACRITVATDVTNPLTGAAGATLVYARQKGATEEELLRMESGMCHLAALYRRYVGRDVAVTPGSGAAGGIALPLIAYYGAVIRSGIDAVLEAVHFDDIVCRATRVITGEGKFDVQSFYGKAVSGVIRRAAARGIPVDILCGMAEDGIKEQARVQLPGIEGIYMVRTYAASEEDSMKEAERYLRICAVAYAHKNG